MDRKYYCPKCKALLNVREYIVFVANNNANERGIVLLSPSLGDYKIIHPPEFRYEEGDRLEFFCPVCHESLAIPYINKDLAEVDMVDKNNERYKIAFSEIAGKKCTIKIKDNSIVEMYGDDADEYKNFWGAGPRY